MYDFTILKTSFFGLIKREEKKSIVIPFESNIKATHQKWDKLISQKTKIK